MRHSACISSVMRLFESIRSVDSLDITHALLPVSLWAYVKQSRALNAKPADVSLGRRKYLVGC